MLRSCCETRFSIPDVCFRIHFYFNLPFQVLMIATRLSENSEWPTHWTGHASQILGSATMRPSRGQAHADGGAAALHPCGSRLAALRGRRDTALWIAGVSLALLQLQRGGNIVRVQRGELRRLCLAHRGGGLELRLLRLQKELKRLQLRDGCVAQAAVRPL